jgi:hypothetical protein
MRTGARLVLALCSFALCLCTARAESARLEVIVQPETVGPGGDIFIGVRCREPGARIVSAKVSLREFPGIDLLLNDSGQQGDAVAGDGLWSFKFSVPPEAPPGNYALRFTAIVEKGQLRQEAQAEQQVRVSEKPEPLVQIISPKAGLPVAGLVPVVASVRIPVPVGEVRARIGASPIAPLGQRSDGLWSGLVDVRKVTNGRQPIVVVASAAGKKASRVAGLLVEPSQALIRTWHAGHEVFVRNPYLFLWGDLHGHSSYSDGVLLPADAYRHARDAAHLDFFSLTDHAQAITAEEFQDLKAQAEAFNQPGRFVTLYGVEWTQGVGHISYFMADDSRLASRLSDFYRQISEMGVLAHFSHPSDAEFIAMAYFPEAERVVVGAEVRNDTEEQAYFKMLANGWYVAPDGSQDKHTATWGDGPHWTVVLAREKTREGLLEALMQRRFYSTWDRNMELFFSIDREDMGSRLARPAGRLPCLVSIRDPDSSDLIAKVELILDGKVVRSTEPKSPQCEWNSAVEFSPGRHWVLARVTQQDGNEAWSSPVWVNAYESPR